jgi:hypothetical protein
MDQKVHEKEGIMGVGLFWKWDATLQIEKSYENHIC